MRNVARLALGLALLAGGALAAADITPDGAKALAGQLHTWLSGTLGADAPDLPVTASAEADHYRVTVPIIGLRTQGGEPAAIAAVRPLGDGRWAVDDIRLPDKFSFTTSPDHGNSATVIVSIEQQHARAIIDPDLRTASSFSLDGTGITTSATDPRRTREQHMDRYAVTGTVTPRSDGLLDVTETGLIEGWQSGTVVRGGPPVGSGARRAKATVHIDGLDRRQVAPTVAALVSLGVLLPSVDTGAGARGLSSLAPAERAALHRLVEALHGIASSVHLDEVLDGVQFELAGVGGAAMDRIRIGIGGDSADGLLHAWFDLGVEGLSIPHLPHDVAGLVPTAIALRPGVAGVPVDALNRLLLEATGPNANTPGHLDDAVAALFARGGLTVTIDALRFAIGPADFTGAGSILLRSPTEHEGQARVTVTGFDALAAQAGNDPRLKVALPALLIARGLAKTEGDKLVWMIASDRSGKLTVNGTDVSALTGAVEHQHHTP